MANLLAKERPPFSALASSVERHPNGVTSYDITPVGPPFAYRVEGVSHFEVPGPDGKPYKFSVVEVKIGPDAESGARSVYEGRAYQIFGESPNGPFVAEIWDDVKATSGVWDVAANLHNDIVDGGPFGKRGFRGLANDAKDLEKKHDGAPPLSHDEPRVKITDALMKFAGDPETFKSVPTDIRTVIVGTLARARHAEATTGGTTTPERTEVERLAHFSGDGPKAGALDQGGARPQGTIAAGPGARFALSHDDD
jgi:hypothetical protein